MYVTVLSVGFSGGHQIKHLFFSPIMIVIAFVTTSRKKLHRALSDDRDFHTCASITWPYSIRNANRRRRPNLWSSSSGIPVMCTFTRFHLRSSPTSFVLSCMTSIYRSVFASPGSSSASRSICSNGLLKGSALVSIINHLDKNSRLKRVTIATRSLDASPIGSRNLEITTFLRFSEEPTKIANEARHLSGLRIYKKRNR